MATLTIETEVYLAMSVYANEVRRTFELCMADRACDPLPADEECRNATS